MPDASYAVVFQGEILDGFEPDQVRQEFARLFGLGAERLEQLFTQGRVILKKGLNREEAERYIARLHRIGALARLETPHPAPVPQAQPVLPPSGDAWGETSAAPVVPDMAAPAFPKAAAAARESAEKRHLPFEFTGTGGEFFRIWIVNLLLSIITLGIYSAWAKVRTNRYFHGNTRLDGNSFEYLADPLKILKGRLIAFALLLVYSMADFVSPFLSPVLGLLFFLALPWIIVRSLSFRNHNTAWRGVRFGFDGSVASAAKVFVLWPLAGMLSLGLLIPLSMQRQRRFVVENSRYGATPFVFSAGAKPFYKLIGVCLLIIIIGGFAAALLSGGGRMEEEGSALPFIPIAIAYLGAFAWFTCASANIIYRHSALADHRLDADYRIGSYLKLMLLNVLGMLLTAGFFYPWAKVRTARYAAEHISLHATGSLDSFVADQRAAASATGGEIGDLFDVDIGL